MKTVHHINLNHIMEAYKARVLAEAARAEAIREGGAKPHPSTVWAISDRH